MTALQWHLPGDMVYHAGLDRGVLYVEGNPGVVWNGLISVDEDEGNSVDEVFYEGIKMNDIVNLGSFSGNIRAFTYPDEFFDCEGIEEDSPGVYFTSQPIKRFGLCYRTLVGEGNSGEMQGYKIHLLYNLTAIPATKQRQTLALDPTPDEFEWKITGIPELIEHYRPTCHVIIDSRDIDPWLLQDLEAIFYGDEDTDAQLPTLKALTNFIQKWDRLIIVDNNDGTWTAIAQRPDIITMLSPTEFSIAADNAVYLDANTYQISSSEKNEEDL